MLHVNNLNFSKNEFAFWILYHTNDIFKSKCGIYWKNLSVDANAAT